MQKLEEAIISIYNNNNNDIKETWKILNSALGKRSKTTTNHTLEANEEDVSNTERTSDELNSYFCNIAQDILKNSGNPSVMHHLDPIFQTFLKRTHYLNLSVSRQ